MTALAAGAITFVSSLAVALGIQLAPDAGHARSKHVEHAQTPQIAEAKTPAVAPPVAEPRPAATGEPVSNAGAPEQSAPTEQPSDPNGLQPYLTRVLEHIPGDTGDPETQP